MGALPQPSNPDNMAAGGATDAQCGGEGRERGDMQQITAHSNSHPSFSLSFRPLCIRLGFDKNAARSSAEQHVYPTLISGLKVHKNENFFGSDFEFCTISLLVMLKY